ncbi:MAG: hypothetical protein EBR09_07820 [Proteobacteria bacterium]|nr:hypothetical protein [Pseudomonadota bacterium]
MKNIGSHIGLALGLALAACAPTQFKSSKDLSSQVKVRPAGFADADGRVNLDCNATEVDGNRFNQGQKPTAIGIPMNCPKSAKGAAVEEPNKFDAVVILDTSENMMQLSSEIKPQIVKILTKLIAENKLASLSAVSFRNKIVASVTASDVAKLIADIGGASEDWSPAGFKKIEANSTEWVTNDAAKAVFAGVAEGIKLIQAGSQPNKLILLVSGSTGTGEDGMNVGPTAKLISEFSTKVASGAGQFILNYAANEKMARGLSSFDPNPIEHLDLLASTAGINALRVKIPSDLGGWSTALGTRTVAPPASDEACQLTGFEASDANGEQIFKKDVAKAELSGMFEASLPAAVPDGKLTLKISRKCARSGAGTQTLKISLAKGGAAK